MIAGLIVIDDVWRTADLRPFLAGGTRCARLITTRRPNTLPVGAGKVSVDEMRECEAGQLLGAGLPAESEDALRTLAVTRLGAWPLLLKLGNAWLRKRISESREPVDRALSAFDLALTQRGVVAFDARNSDERDAAVAKTLELSFAGLQLVDQTRLLELAVFEEDLKIPLHVLERFWMHTGSINELEVEETCQRLFHESLLLKFDLAERFIRLHDAIRAWLTTRVSSVPLDERHAQLVASYEQSGVAWHRISDDGYIYAHLARHLAAAGRHEALQAILFDVDWIEARLTTTRRGEGANATVDVFSVLADYDALPAQSADLTLVRRALQMSTHVIATHPEQLRLQLYGRLGTSESPAIRRLLHGAIEESCTDLLPLRPALQAPGPLLLTLTGHKDGVFGAALLAEGRQALSWSEDGTLKLWDLERGALLHTLAGHKDGVDGADLLAEGRQALSWSEDGTLKLWDLERGALLHTLVGHKGWVLG